VAYCASRFHSVRRRTVEVKVGHVGVGAHHPVRIQSMTTSDTQDIAATLLGLSFALLLVVTLLQRRRG